MINAIELPTDAVGRTIEFNTVAAWDYHAMKFGVEFGDKITVRGTIVDVIRKTQLTGRAVVTVIMDCTDTDGESFRTQFNLGSHNRFEYVEENSAPKCAAPWGCTESATHVALDIDGETKVPVCKIDSDTAPFWAVWPIENDDQFGASVGGSDSDAVPVGSNRPAGNWTGRERSVVRSAERMVRNGMRPDNYAEIVCDELSRLIDTRRRRAAMAGINEATGQFRDGLISAAYRDRMISEALDSMRHVSLDKIVSQA